MEENTMAMANLPKRRHDGHTDRRRVVIITHGKNPTIVSDGITVAKFDVPYIPPEDIIDANGAGDAFCGGFLAAYMQGASLEEAVQRGHHTAGYIIRTSGVVFPRIH